MLSYCLENLDCLCHRNFANDFQCIICALLSDSILNLRKKAFCEKNIGAIKRLLKEVLGENGGAL